MYALLNSIIQAATFPGIIAHELSHQLCCHLLGIKVYKVCYLRLGNPPGYVIHAQPNAYYKTFFISMAPLFLSTLFAAGAFIYHHHVHEPVWQYTLLWFGFAIAAHAFPSTTDAQVLWRATTQHCLRDVLALLALPFVILIYIVAHLRFLWLNLAYGALLLWTLHHYGW